MPYTDPEKGKAQKREYYRRNKTRLIAAMRANVKKKPEANAIRQKRYWLKRDYGLSESDFHALYHQQGSTCAVCQEALLLNGLLSIGPVSERCCVDHSHETGKVRGLVHQRCNLVLGNAKDSPDILRAAAVYLERQ